MSEKEVHTRKVAYTIGLQEEEAAVKRMEEDIWFTKLRLREQNTEAHWGLK